MPVKCSTCLVYHQVFQPTFARFHLCFKVSIWGVKRKRENGRLLTCKLVKVWTWISVKIYIFTYRLGCILTSLCSAFSQAIIRHRTCTRNKCSPHICLLKAYKEMQRGKEKERDWDAVFACSLAVSLNQRQINSPCTVVSMLPFSDPFLLNYVRFIFTGGADNENLPYT